MVNAPLEEISIGFGHSGVHTLSHDLWPMSVLSGAMLVGVGVGNVGGYSIVLCSCQMSVSAFESVHSSLGGITGSPSPRHHTLSTRGPN